MTMINGHNLLPDTAHTLTAEEITSLPMYVADVLRDLGAGYSTKRHNPDSRALEAVEAGQMLLKRLLVGLGADQTVKHREVVNGDWTPDDLYTDATLLIPAIVKAPILEREQKVTLLAQYPTYLMEGGHSPSYQEAQTEVRDMLHSTNWGSPDDQAKQQQVIDAIEWQWSQERTDRMGRVLGFVADVK